MFVIMENIELVQNAIKCPHQELLAIFKQVYLSNLKSLCSGAPYTVSKSVQCGQEYSRVGVE